MGMLKNTAGKGKYMNEDAPEKVIAYILRQGKHASRRDDLLAWGTKGCFEWDDAAQIAEEFYLVQKEMYSRKGKFGRRLNHEIYALNLEECAAVKRKHVDVDDMARRMADQIFKEGYQTVYAVHDEGNGRLAIHFAINTVNYRTGKKRREWKRETQEHNKQFDEIVRRECRRCGKKNSSQRKLRREFE